MGSFTWESPQPLRCPRCRPAALRAPRFSDEARAARPDARRARLDQGQGIGIGAHAARRLDAHVRPDSAAHQGDVVHGCPARPEPRRSLDEVGSGFLGDAAGGDLLVIGEQARFQDHLADATVRVHDSDDCRDVAAQQVEIARLQRADILHHVYVMRAIDQRLLRFEGFDFGSRRAQRETGHRADDHAIGVGQQLRRQRHIGRVHRCRGEAMRPRLVAQRDNLIVRDFRLEQSMVNHARKLGSTEWMSHRK